MGSSINQPTTVRSRLPKILFAAVVSFGFAISGGLEAHAQKHETMQTGSVAANRVADTGGQNGNSGLVAVSTTGETSPGSFARNPGNLLAAEGQNAQQSDSVSLPGSVIALVVALIAVVAVARRDVSGTTRNP